MTNFERLQKINKGYEYKYVLIWRDTDGNCPFIFINLQNPIKSSLEILENMNLDRCDLMFTNEI